MVNDLVAWTGAAAVASSVEIEVPDENLSRQQRRAHAWARFGARLPRPAMWFVHQVVCRLMMPPLRGRQQCPTVFGYSVVVRRSHGLQYYWHGFYEQGTMHVIASCLRPGDVFVDAGASVGQMSFLAARIVGAQGKVLAFEPAPERHDDLAAGVAINGLSNVSAFPCGLGAEDGEAELFLVGSPTMSQQQASGRSVRVPVRRLDDVLAERQIGRVRMIKIDVEGLEPEVLLGARRLLESAEPPIICYEHGVYRHTRSVPELLPRDYVLFQLAGTAHRVSRLVEVKPRRLRGDNVFAIPRSQLTSLPRTLFEPRLLG